MASRAGPKRHRCPGSDGPAAPETHVGFPLRAGTLHQGDAVRVLLDAGGADVYPIEIDAATDIVSVDGTSWRRVGYVCIDAPLAASESSIPRYVPIPVCPLPKPLTEQEQLDSVEPKQN
jgi:hypothetical protein